MQKRTSAHGAVIAMVLQIIQHSGPLPVSEDNGATKPVLSRKAESPLSDLAAVPPRSRNSTRPQHQEAGNVEGILTLQLSHPNVVQTYKAATRPLQVFPPYCLQKLKAAYAHSSL